MIRPKLCGNCAFSQNFHTRKSGEITVFFCSDCCKLLSLIKKSNDGEIIYKQHHLNQMHQYLMRQKIRIIKIQTITVQIHQRKISLIISGIAIPEKLLPLLSKGLVLKLETKKVPDIDVLCCTEVSVKKLLYKRIGE